MDTINGKYIIGITAVIIILTTIAGAVPANQPRTTGTTKAIVILTGFSDVRASSIHAPSYYNNMLFNTSPGANSLNNYYREVSYNQLNITGAVSQKWYTSNRTMSYYGADSSTGGSDNANGNISRLAEEVISMAANDINFSQYDSDGDGVVDHVIIIHAGDDQASSHIPADVRSNQGILNMSVNGIKIMSYVLISESSHLGTFAHEFGHDIGLPDLYNTDTSSSVVGEWDLMDGGEWNNNGDTPVHLSAWSKIQLGWITPITITAQTTINIPQVETNRYNSVYKISSSNMPSNEYFLIENRQKTGYDSYLPDAGIIIWHIDDSQASVIDKGINDGAIKRVAVEDASNGLIPDLHGAAYSSNNHRTAFSPASSPSSNSNTGISTGISIYDIGLSGYSMNVSFSKTVISTSVHTVCRSGCNHTSIQAAISAANRGDTVQVYSGMYNENVNVNKQIVIRGIDNGGGKPVVNADGAGNAITLNAGLSTLDGFTVVNARARFAAGIVVNSNNNIISNNSASNNYNGIYLQSSSNDILTGNTANSNDNTGIELDNSVNNTLRGNTANGNNGSGIYLSSGSNTLESNNVLNNLNGIYLESSGNNILANNTANLNRNTGIALYSSSNNILSDNNASNNQFGIELNSSNNNTLKNNFVSSNSNIGVHFQFSNSNILNGNAANSNNNGIELAVSNNNILSGNTADTNNLLGIFLYVSSNNILSNNEINSNNEVGLFLNSSNSNTLRKNTANLNKNGIELQYSNNTLESNTANLNDNFGIILSGSSANILTNNSANSNKKIGIALSYSNNNTLSGNTANLNRENGIALIDSSINNVLSGNTANGNNGSGIFIQASGNNKIHSNSFNNIRNYIILNPAVNIWNSTEIRVMDITGSLSPGGNFWADPGGMGFSQTCTDADADGICDSPYVLDSSNIDYLPLAYDPVILSTPAPTPTATPSAGESIVSVYAGSDGVVQRSEAVRAVMDYFNGTITRQNAIDVVMAYFT